MANALITNGYVTMTMTVATVLMSFPARIKAVIKTSLHATVDTVLANSGSAMAIWIVGMAPMRKVFFLRPF